MIVYNPYYAKIIEERIKAAQGLLDEIPAKYCFITGSFIYKTKYRDIDIFVVTRSKKEIKTSNKKAKVTIIDFNNLYSLYYHSISKSCIAKNILPTKPLKVTISDYWYVINEAVPTLFNRKNKYHKDVRFLVLYTEYFMTGEILDTFQLDKKISNFRNYDDILKYIKENVPKVMNRHRKKSYLKRFFYTQAGFYKDLRDYSAQSFLYNLTHSITRCIAHG
ncbi:hypothetical protein HY500_04625 [Candidatus Woesearchaeota archaeon]|nr:hypothetical protein [Candidatus Woesearchaeota archaeon]